MRPYYEHAGITIYHGDCREIAHDLGRVTMLISDPPYGMNDRTRRASAGRGGRNGLKTKASVPSCDWEPIFGDDQAFDPLPWLRYEKVVLFGAIHYSAKLPQSRAWLVWDKRCRTDSDDNADCDFAWTNLRGPARLHSQLWRGLCREGEENGARSPGLQHPTQKPIALMLWVLRQCKPAINDVILDPYAGVGTTLLAAKRMVVPAIGIEIEERYCEIAAKRLSQEVLPFEA